MIELPASKSIASRFMVAGFFAGTLPADPLFQDNDDLMVLQDALLEVYSDEEPIDYGDSPIDVGASGTALRFLTAVCASSPGADYVITGSPRLMERPMSELLQLLHQAGAGIKTLGINGLGPYRVTGARINGGNFSIRGDISSQFISALMLVSPYWEKGMTLNFLTPLVSAPYIKMTAKIMEKFGVKVTLSDNFVKVPQGTYNVLDDFEVEPDWSAASFFYEASALGASDIEISRLKSPDDSLQGDAVTDSLFAKIGVVSAFSSKGVKLSLNNIKPKEIEGDFKDCPDLLLPFAVACLCKGIKFKFTNVSHLRLKESDRLESLRQEAQKLGFSIKTSKNDITWDGNQTGFDNNVVINPHDDHRVAMAFAMCAYKFGEIKIANPRVVEKSFNDFWNQLENAGLTCSFSENSVTIKK